MSKAAAAPLFTSLIFVNFSSDLMRKPQRRKEKQVCLLIWNRLNKIRLLLRSMRNQKISRDFPGAKRSFLCGISYKLSVRPVSAIDSQSALITQSKPKKKSLSSSREESSCPVAGAKALKTIGQEKAPKEEDEKSFASR